MSCFVIIGGSQSHVPLIQAAKHLGYRTVVFDRNPSAPAAHLADRFYAISTHDGETISKICNELNKDEGLRGIMTCSAYSKPLFTVAVLCRRFRLSSFSVESVNLSVNKNEMKKRFFESGISSPESVVTNRFDKAARFLSAHSLPWIVKPCSGSQGSSGVSIVNEVDELKGSFAEASKISQNGSVVIEKYYEGREFSVDGIVNDKEPLILAVSEKFNLGFENNFTISGFATGPISDEDNSLKRNILSIHNIALDAVRSLKIDNSFFSVDVILTDDGPLVLECGVLLDAKIDRLLHFAGVDIYEMICRLAAGERIETASPKFQKGYALKFMFAQKEGELKIIHNDTKSSKKEDRRILIEWEREEGDPVRSPRSISDTLGWVITEGNDGKAAYCRARKISEEQRFQVI